VSVRSRLTVALTLSTLAVAAIVGIAATLLTVWRADDPDGGSRAGAARIGEDVAVVVVAEEQAGEAAADARQDALRWMLVALGLSIVPAVAVGWFVSSRVLGTVDQALADVEAKDRERRRRLDEVVHELRTPLAIAGTNLELAAADPALADDTVDLIDAARRANERMRRTVDDLADHGRLAVDLDGASVDVVTEARAVVAEHFGPARARGIDVRLVAPDPLLPVAGDRAAVRTALGNVCSNAVRLAPRGSVITVSCGELAGWVWAAVSDEGPGLPAHLHARAFERGWRGRHDRDREPTAETRGLGLTISRQLVEANGGLLTIDSEEGAGSTFTVWLPARPDAAPDDVVAADRIHPARRPWQVPISAARPVQPAPS
jgi:signal transduction histidine kinase